MVPLQVTASLSVPLLFLAGIVAGVVATLAMDVVMARIDEGATPPQIASGVLTERHPDRAPGRLASVVHYVAGALTGPLFVWLLLVGEGLFGAGTLALLAAAVVCYPLMVGFFALVVLPRSTGLARQRLRRIRRAWSIEAAVYLLVLAPLVGVAATVL
jgi:TRAP-type C4-dicarboxylate transport system permease large subunit